MKKTVSFYDKATGIFTGQRYSGPDKALADLPAGVAFVEGDHHPALWCVKAGKVVAREAPPGHVWHAPSGTFIEQAKLAAAKRDLDARAEIARLEFSQHRAVREAALGDAEALARVRATDARITELRKELANAL